MRIILLIALILIMSIQTVFAGVYNDIVNSKSKTLLYLYTPECSYCVTFNKIYQKLTQKFGNNCKFVKVNAHSSEGMKLMQKYRGVFVPYILLIDNNKEYVAMLSPNCLFDYACTSSAVENFIKK